MERHLEEKEYLDIFDANAFLKNTKNARKRQYKELIKKWLSPRQMNNSKTGNLKNHEILYLSICCMLYGEKINYKILEGKGIKCSEIALKFALQDYKEINKTIEEFIRVSPKSRNMTLGLYPYILKLCAICGVKSFKEVKNENILDENLKKTLNAKSGNIYRLLNLKYILGYNDLPPAKVISKYKKSISIDNEFSVEINEILLEYTQILNRYNCIKTVKYNIMATKKFLYWFFKSDESNFKKNMLLLDIDSEVWKNYVVYQIENDKYIEKTRRARLLATFKFLEWGKIYYPDKFNKNLNISKDDFKKLSTTNNINKSLAFNKASDVEKILNYLTLEYKAETIYEEFAKEIIIIVANSGMRRSEIGELEFNNIEYCEEAGLYKIIKKDIDKLGRKNRTIWITKDGYESIKRVECLRKKNDYLTAKRGRNGEKAFIRLFEYKSKDISEGDAVDNLINKIAKIKKIYINNNNKVAKLHGFRHFFAVNVFRESGYNLSVVKFLLGHKDYNMSKVYLKQEQKREIVKVRELVDKPKFAGLGVEKIVNSIINENKNDFILKRKLDSIYYEGLEIFDIKKMKKLEIGYCIEPCENVDKCFKCNNFLVEKSDLSLLINYAKELLEIILYKKSIIKNIDDEILIKKDITDFTFLLTEIKTLGIKEEEIYKFMVGDKNE